MSKILLVLGITLILFSLFLLFATLVSSADYSVNLTESIGVANNENNGSNTVILEVNNTESLGQLIKSNTLIKDAVSAVYALAIAPIPIPSPKVEVNTTNQTTDIPPSSTFLVDMFTYAIFIVAIGVVIFGIYLMIRKFIKSKKSKSELEPIGGLVLSPQIKDKLRQYKQDSESWDSFMNKVLILIERDARGGK
jgi:hypothetical protein